MSPISTADRLGYNSSASLMRSMVVRRGTSFLAGALALATLSVSLIAWQGASRSATLSDYAAVVDRYRLGQIDAAIEQVTAADRRWIEDAIRLLDRAEWPAVDLKAAALL